MSYPYIMTVEDILPTITDLPEIGIIEKDKYTLLQYNVAFPETFNTSLARECRGIMFDKSGSIIRRPFHKFFNINEKPETQQRNFDGWILTSITKKMDGMMIAPVIVDGEIIWASKRCSDDIHQFIENHPLITDALRHFVREMCKSGSTPIFEFHDPNFELSRIVVNYNAAFFKLLAIRSNDTGEYFSRYVLETVAATYKFEIVEECNRKFDTLDNLLTHTLLLEHAEGYVAVLQSDHQEIYIKVKSPWYVKRHRIKEYFQFDHIKAQLVLDGHPDAKIDDVTPFLDKQGIIKFNQFAEGLRTEIVKLSKHCVRCSERYNTKKEFAQSSDFPHPLSCIIFQLIENRTSITEEISFDLVRQMYLKHSTKGIRFKTFRESVGLV